MKKKIVTVNKPELLGSPGINSNFHLSQERSPIDIFHLVFNSEIF
jgi:hypothetical protein